MSEQNQVKKNILLSSKFSTYLEKKPEILDKISANAEYVVLSANDKELNKMNEIIINSLKKMGKKVVKVQETGKPETPWELTPIPL